MASKVAEAAAPPAPMPEIQLSGTGKFYYPSGATYEGEWKLLNPPLPPPPEDPKEKKKKPAKDEPPPPPPEPPKRVRHGRGVYREGDYMYDGEFFEDVITGYGTFRYASGSTYSGEWKTGKYHGKVSMDLPATLCTRGHLRCA